MKRATFQQVLQGLGHIYEACEDGASYSATRRLRHMSTAMNDDGIPIALCTGIPIEDHELAVSIYELWRDADCPACRVMAELEPASLTKRNVMIESVHIMINIEQLFLDAMHYNGHRPEGEEAINPDPEGELALAWQENAGQVISMIERCRPTMTKHADRFGWPEEVSSE